MVQGPCPGQVRNPMLKVEVDPGSGFCGGVIRAISKAESFLDNKGTRLHSLGSIVHNEAELERLGSKGLVTIDADDLENLPGADVLIRAHGEPPSTYEKAAEAGINIIDCTCPVVLQLQKRIREAYPALKAAGGTLVIFGKVGHAEVLGLVGQVGGDAVVVEDMPMLEDALASGRIRRDAPVEVFSQTTKSPQEYSEICSVLRSRAVNVTVHDTICRQVASRHEKLAAFAAGHDVVVFVSGRSSSNGKVLSELCLGVNPRTYRIVSEDEISADWFEGAESVGVCGATSTPKWLLDAVAQKICRLSDKSVNLQAIRKINQ